LIYIPGVDTDELWGNVMQPSKIQITHKGKELSEEGKLIIETCRMTKINPHKKIDWPTENVNIGSKDTNNLK